jgi:hypothetical protein
MKTIVWGILVAALACGSGCTRPDWIEQTLVTVDVTGTWLGSVGGTGGQGGASYELVLEQQGPKVKGSVQRHGSVPPSATSGNLSGPIAGTVAGDVFSFRQTNGPLTGETTVSGDEMTGEVSFVLVRTITLRRVNSPSRPRSQEP